MENIISINHALGRKPRAGETESTVERSNRFVNNDEGWFYKTRENRLVGPYTQRSIAEKDARSFARFAQNLGSEKLEQLIVSHIETLEARNRGTVTERIRVGEWQAGKYRSPRIYQENGLWFFRTREGRAVGSYPSEGEAHEAVETFKKFAMVVKASAVDALISAMMPKQ